MRYTHPNPLRSEGESRQRRGAKDLATLAAQAAASGVTVNRVTPQEIRESAERNAAILRKKRRASGLRGAETRAAAKREAARTASATSGGSDEPTTHTAR